MRALGLVGSCVVLGVGVALVLTAGLGSDGYSTLLSGLTRSTDLAFWVVSVIVGGALVVLAATRRQLPGVGTLVQPVVTGVTVSVLLGVLEQPDALGLRLLLLVAAFPVLAVGVAGYLSVGLGAGPTEGAALAFDPPLPFRWAYPVVQAIGAVVGWLLGAAVGPGTLLVSLGLGPLVGWLGTRVPVLAVRRRDVPAPRG